LEKRRGGRGQGRQCRGGSNKRLPLYTSKRKRSQQKKEGRGGKIFTLGEGKGFQKHELLPVIRRDLPPSREWTGSGVENIPGEDRTGVENIMTAESRGLEKPTETKRGGREPAVPFKVNQEMRRVKEQLFKPRGYRRGKWESKGRADRKIGDTSGGAAREVQHGKAQRGGISG